ncbi:hypothetical protein [Pseudomonas sp. NPDC096950]|uniref:hypothetical protein n=1 Tax=Pseudomonas sp. NPDC096950 TaxID=3364485 RepID=UPI00383AC75E
MSDENEHRIREGMIVEVKTGEIRRLLVSEAKKFQGRKGTVLRVFTQLGSTTVNARVKWHKRAGRGKEFEQIFCLNQLMPSPEALESELPANA